MVTCSRQVIYWGACGIAVAVLSSCTPMRGLQSPQALKRPGELYNIRLTRVSETSGDLSSGNSRDVWNFVERVVAIRDGGEELEFDLPRGTSPEDGMRSWQFPARVFVAPERHLALLNWPEAEMRLQSWLGDRKESLCGHWSFTWTAQRIDCDAQSVVQMLEPFMWPNDLRDGTLHTETGARSPAPLRETRNSDGATFIAQMEVDPDAIRRERAEADLVVAEILHRGPLTMEAALQAHSNEKISGTLTVTFGTDAARRVTRRTRITQTDVFDERGSHQHETITETVEWRLVSPSTRP